ncbi:MAG: hypothetical protein ACYC7D_15975 [Nitrososphaerales archaeon]
MKFAKTALLLFIVALVVIVSGLYIKTLDSGSCPAMLSGSPALPCYHTFPNTNIYITPTGDSVIDVGIGLAMVSLAFFLYGQFTRDHSIKSSVEYTNA